MNFRNSLVLAVFFSITVMVCGCQTLGKTPIDIAAGENLIVSPAEGRIVTIAEVGEGEIPVVRDAGKTASLTELGGMLKGKCRLVLIFMRPLNYHGVLSPISGELKMITHVPGRFRNLFGRYAYLENERTTIVIDGNIRIAVIPIAGYLYRRIVCQVKPEERILRGWPLGKIIMGSAVAVVLPAECEITVRTGDRVRAGKSIIARTLGQ
ncbi:MAG: phosphatidylserine decarboxylase [Candidatus Omnitrophica bacterium]|nr:phosphatidylserine decarboxylase [Candidatus Omnitrophota bacterium]